MIYAWNLYHWQFVRDTWNIIFSSSASALGVPGELCVCDVMLWSPPPHPPSLLNKQTLSQGAAAILLHLCIELQENEFPWQRMHKHATIWIHTEHRHCTTLNPPSSSTWRLLLDGWHLWTNVCWFLRTCAHIFNEHKLITNEQRFIKNYGLRSQDGFTHVPPRQIQATEMRFLAGLSLLFLSFLASFEKIGCYLV